MNEKIKLMQCGLRLNETDGFSEISAKSILWGQWPIGRIKHPHITHYDGNNLIMNLKDLKNKKQPNVEGRDFYRRILNQYPWVN